MKDVQQPVALREAIQPPPGPVRRREAVRIREEWHQFVVLLKRAFLSKLRNRANLLTTILEAPLLAVLTGMVLRYSESDVYDFASAFHIPTYLFLSLVVAMFLGLTNSVDDIIRDRAVLMRERNLDVRLFYYVLAKGLTLAAFALIQCALFAWIGNWLLSMRDGFWIVFIAMFLTTASGIAIGLVVLAGIFAVGPISGCVLNPGVATGMVVMGLLKASDAWIYLAGQFAGAVAAAVAFKSLIPASIRG
jgi:hypothetical protein